MTGGAGSNAVTPRPEIAVGHLRREGLGDRAVNVGDVMTDVCFRVRDAVEARPAAMPGYGPSIGTGDYVVSTVHRAENTDDPKRLEAIVDALAALPVAVVLLAHPRLVARCRDFGIPLERPGSALHVTEPLAYPDMVAAVMRSSGVVTDSGGLQKEAFLLGRPCTTVRTETEWVETLTDGWNVLSPDLADLADVVTRPVPTAPRAMPYGDGHAASRVVTELTARAGVSV